MNIIPFLSFNPLKFERMNGFGLNLVYGFFGPISTGCPKKKGTKVNCHYYVSGVHTGLILLYHVKLMCMFCVANVSFQNIIYSCYGSHFHKDNDFTDIPGQW